MAVAALMFLAAVTLDAPGAAACAGVYVPKLDQCVCPPPICEQCDTYLANVTICKPGE